MGHAQAQALGYADLPIAVMPHPFGLLTRAEVRTLASTLVDQIAILACEAVPVTSTAMTRADSQIAMLAVPDDLDEINRLFRKNDWTDGLPIVPPTARRVERMLACTHRNADDVIATIAPGYGIATVKRIAVNAVMAGCDPEYLPLLIAAVEAVVPAEFNLQGIQTTTNPVAVWLIVNGPVVKRLNLNAGINCLGQGNWANATLGRALHLILQNVGRALPGEMDRATHGQPGKYVFCCAESDELNPWEPLHVEKGYRLDQCTVTVVGAEGTLNMNTHVKNADDLLHVIAETLPRPPSNDYLHGGNPWLILCPEHADILKSAGLSKSDVKRRLWEQSKMAVRRLPAKDLERIQSIRRPELGTFTADTLLPITKVPDDIGIIVAGGSGTHSLYIPSLGSTRSVTREIIWCA